MSPRKILIADPDLDTVRHLSRALREKGYQVHYAPDGSRALEVSVLRHPDLVLFDENCPLLDARTFVNILRTNPRTEHIPVLVSTVSVDTDRLRFVREGYLRKPFNLDEVLSRIEHLCRRQEAARELKGEAREIEGNLTQLPLPDLLQILAMNKRSGRLALHRGNEKGEIHLSEGRPANARIGAVEGEKALYRLLMWTEGTFAFVPGSAGAKLKISLGMEEALMEGMRQGDEVARLREKLPPRHTRLSLSLTSDLSLDQHPMTSQVLELLSQGRSLGELLDLAPAPDLDVLTVLETLLEKGVAQVEEGVDAAGAEPLLGPAEVHALRSQVLKGRNQLRSAVAKVLLLGSPAAMQSFLSQIPGVSLFPTQPETLSALFGSLGRLEVSEVLKLDFCALPSGDSGRPLWRPFSAGAVGALLLDAGAEPLVEESFSRELRLPVLAVSDSAIGSLRTLLHRALEPLQRLVG